jgi:hypothetical protein
MRLFHACQTLALAAALAAAVAGQASAQNLPSVSNGFQPPIKAKPQTRTTETPPPALPGTLNQFGPAERTQLDLAPTEALFDAINRGDITAARDAVNRGAELTGRNILGMTPLELSVDLSRNEITFLLLSLRGSGGAAGGPPPTIAAGASKAPVAKAAAHAPPKQPGSTQAPRSAAVQSRPTPAATARLPVAPQQFAGPGSTGTPDPQAGFLGFGSSLQ